MTNIMIGRSIQGYFSFFRGDKPAIASGGFRCWKCKCIVFNIYAKIINKLKKSGLLNKHYPLLCCQCFNVGEKVKGMRCPKCFNSLEWEWTEPEKRMMQIKCTKCKFKKLSCWC